jgi:hypothetical protein
MSAKFHIDWTYTCNPVDVQRPVAISALMCRQKFPPQRPCLSGTIADHTCVPTGQEASVPSPLTCLWRNWAPLLIVMMNKSSRNSVSVVVFSVH